MNIKNLGVGEIYFAKDHEVITTILGSCVSVCLYHPQLGCGGIIHFALPDKDHAKNSSRSSLNFGDYATQNLIDGLLEIPGVTRSGLKAKIIGGAKVIEDVVHSSLIGDLNVTIARKILLKNNISVVAEDVGGKEGRKIFFYTDSGRVRVSKLANKHSVDVQSSVIKKKEKIKVLIIDDSKTIRDLLSKMISCDEIAIVGTAANAFEAEPLLAKLSPDVITLDIHMPGMDGVSFLQKYLPKHPIPTIMISSININESDQVLRALEFGAVDYLQKPTLAEITNHTTVIREKIITASGIKVRTKSLMDPLLYKNNLSFSGKSEKVIAIGASTGGTEAIKAVLLSLPANIPPIIIVQHIPPVFSAAFANRLNELCPFEVKEAVNGDLVIAGRVLIAPGGFQMELVKDSAQLKVKVFAGERVNRHIPSVDVLFNSVAREIGARAVGVILTGMGNDGASGLLQMRNKGSFTIAQDQASCVVYGMPKAAVELKAVIKTCPLSKVSEEIIRNIENKDAA
jgi:two-component system, chemotaxis family, protein-glutamate methylesterase/glutaminase